MVMTLLTVAGAAAGFAAAASSPARDFLKRPYMTMAMRQDKVSVMACTHIRPLTPNSAFSTTHSTEKITPRRSTASISEVFHLPTA